MRDTISASAGRDDNWSRQLTVAVTFEREHAISVAFVRLDEHALR
jgi:hypothetical protein